MHEARPNLLGDGVDRFDRCVERFALDFARLLRRLHGARDDVLLACLPVSSFPCANTKRIAI